LHDVLTVLGIFSILGGLFAFMPLEMDQSIIAAFLTIAGYSITDTVVVYDRIRERIRGQKPSEYERIFNESMNQTLNRTIITSGICLCRLYWYPDWYLLFNLCGGTSCL